MEDELYAIIGYQARRIAELKEENTMLKIEVTVSRLTPLFCPSVNGTEKIS